MKRVSILLKFDRNVREKSRYKLIRMLRAAISRLDARDLFHQHSENGGFLYRYPLIQYGWRNGQALLIGWNRGADVLLTKQWLDLSLKIGEESLIVKDVVLEHFNGDITVSKTMQKYYFSTPCLLLNKKNYLNFKQLTNKEKTFELNRLLIANLLTAMKGLDFRFPVQLYGSFINATTKKIFFKDTHLIGINGEFVMNVNLPTDLAIGHGVSHGFGIISKA